MMAKQIIVIGGGILGTSTALHLALLGEKVIVIDRYDKGRATSVAAGIISPWLSQRRNKAWYFLARNGAAYYRELVERLHDLGQMSVGYEQVGAIHVHTEEKRIDAIIALAEKRKVEAPEIGEVTKLTHHQLTEYFPLLNGEYYGVHVSGGAKVDGQLLTEKMKKAAQSLGVEWITGNASLQIEKNKVTGAIVEGNAIVADQVIITTGAWGNELLQQLSINGSVRPQKAQILQLQVNDENTEKLPVVMAPSTLYILAFEEGRLLVGTTHEDHVGFDTRPTAGAAYDILQQAFAYAPKLHDAQLQEIFVGFRPVVPTAIPVIGRLPGYPNVLMANGLGSSGLTVGPYLGKELANLAHNNTSNLNLEDYALASILT